MFAVIVWLSKPVGSPMAADYLSSTQPGAG